LHLSFQLKTPATLNKTVKTVPLPEKESHKHCMVMGWGLLGYPDGSHPSKVLREANVTLLDSKNCGTKDTLCSAGKIGPAMVFQVASLTNYYLRCFVSAV